MKSYAHQRFSPKRVKKLAATFTDEEIRASLDALGPICYVEENKDGSALVGSWTAGGGMTWMNDDDVLAYAQVAYMRRNGYPVFRTDAELIAHAKANDWPMKQRD
jgi:hypothetical protein